MWHLAKGRPPYRKNILYKGSRGKRLLSPAGPRMDELHPKRLVRSLEVSDIVLAMVYYCNTLHVDCRVQYVPK